MNGSRSIRRVLLALDAAAPGRDALEAAAALAARLDADLQALLVEDPVLRRAVGQPARHLALLGGALLAEGAVAAGLEAVARSVRADLERVAARARVRWSLRVVEEPDAPGAMAGGRESLLVLERATPFGSRVPAAEPGEPPVLVLGPTARRGRPPLPDPIWTVWDASEAARQALELALQLAAGGRATLQLLVAAPDLRAAERLVEEGRALTGRASMGWRWTGGPSLGDLVRAFPVDALVVVASASAEAAGPGGRERLLQAAPGPVLLVGRATPAPPPERPGAARGPR